MLIQVFQVWQGASHCYHSDMRTLEVTDEAYEAAAAIAHERKADLGDIASELIMRAAQSPAPPLEIKIVNGIPTVRIGRVITDEDVRAAIEEE